MTELPWVACLLKLQSQGFKEIEGPESNPKILEWSRVAAKYPYMNDDSTTPWCGIGLAGVFYDINMKEAIPKDSAAAISWLNCGEPCEAKRGAVVVFPRPGGNHVAVILAVKGEILECIGCNQNNAITTTNFYASQARGYRWPKGASMTTTEIKINPVTERYKELLERSQVKPEWQSSIDKIANVIVANKEKYKEVEEETGVPWAFIGALHYRESNNNFKTHLHNGDPLSGRTFQVPAGRPKEGEPPFTWIESAIDALEYEGFDNKKDWSLENICERGEVYNGLGYRRMGKPSPYLWSGTNNYVRGKYVEDGVYNGNTVDQQAGIIPVYLRVMELAHEKIIRENSRKLNIISWVRDGIKTLIGVIGGLFTMDSFGVFKDWLSVASGIFDPKILITLAVCGALVWVLVNWLDRLMMQDAKAGTWVPSGLSEPDVIDEPTEDVSDIPVKTPIDEPPHAMVDPNTKLD